MPLKFEIDREAHAELPEATQALYAPHGDKFRLQVEGIDPADELKEALRKEREQSAAAKAEARRMQAEREAAEREAQEKRGELPENSPRNWSNCAPMWPTVPAKPPPARSSAR